MNLLVELEERGFVDHLSAPDIARVLQDQRVCVYAGFDPTADSLHLGNLVPILMLSHFQRAGHRVIVLIGGATGMVGDPSGRSTERNLLTTEQVQANLEGQKRQLSRFLDFSDPDKAILVNNHDWIGSMSFIDWLRDVGKYFSVNTMLAKESVKARLASESGISFTEFSYQTMQAYDFLHLFRAEGCTFQLGGNDQWGNITAGLDLIRKVEAKPAYGLTHPLIKTAGGEKFGKSAGNAIWLDADRTSPYDFYQYFIRTQDADVESFLKLFTFLPLEEICTLAAAHQQAPEQREAQKRLAFEITARVHGDQTAQAVQRSSLALFSGRVAALDAPAAEQILREVPTVQVPADRLAAAIDIIDALVESGLCKSRGQARRDLQSGSIYVNDARAAPEATISSSDLLHDKHVFLRRGKKTYAALIVQ